MFTKTWYREEAVEKLVSSELSKLNINNPRLVEWIRKALKEGNKDKIEYHASSLQELRKRQDQINKRLDKIYEDKLDEKITEKFYEIHIERYKLELQEILKSIEKHTNANDKYHELGLNLYELSQKASMLYHSLETDDKRILVNLIFSELILNNEKITATYSKAFQILSELVNVANSSKIEKEGKIVARILEPKKKIDYTVQIGDFYASRPVWLPSISTLRTSFLESEETYQPIFI